MSAHSMITKYIPVSPQEAADKDVMLEYIALFDNLFSRANRMGHFTSSGFIVNETLDKVLCVHHNIYDSWGWTGGHMDGDVDFRKVALKEAREETGVEHFTFMTSEIDSLDILDVPGHFKNGAYISSHVHLSVAYVLIANDDDPVFVKADENSGVKWFALDELLEIVNEPHMRVVYQKLIDRVHAYKNNQKKT